MHGESQCYLIFLLILQFLKYDVKWMLFFFLPIALLILMVFRCINVAWFQSCIHTDTDYVCKEIPTGYPAGLTSLILFTSDLGEIDLSIFNSTNLTSVISLKITQAKVTAVAPRTFDKFHNLKTLLLDDNHISDVSLEWFSHPDSLETLRLSNNKITMLDHSSLFGMTNLLTLNLSRNQIHTITPSSFISTSKLRQLDLSNNNLTNLSVDVLRPLNATKIRLDGNPWDCSCSVHDFAEFLRGLQNVSLLENEMLVCCSSPPKLKGKPVWQVQECKTLTTVSQTNEDPNAITTSPAIGGSASITKPFTIRPSTLISLIVVLCALVLVICVLSVLYHRKRERKHLQTVKPSLEKTKSVNTGKKAEKNSKRVKSEIPEQAQIPTTGMLLRTHRAVVGDEMTSQIYHIYSSGIYQNREPIKRVSSAGPILCRTELFTKQMEVAEEFDALKSDEYYDGCMASEQQKENVRVNHNVCEEAEHQEKDGRMGKEGEENTSLKDVVGYSTDTHRSCDGWLRENSLETDGAKAGTSMDKEAPHSFVKNEVMTREEHQNNATSQNAESSQAVSQEEFVENVENLPYLTIGADPEKQSSVVKQSTPTGGTRSGALRPIRRVLTWPPTAVQWKKQWIQNQQVLNVFPKIIFVTGCRQFQHSVCPTSIPTGREFNALEFLPENSLPQEDVRVTIDGDTYWRNVGSFNAQESLSGNISPQIDARIVSKKEAFESSILSDIFSKNSPGGESEVSSELFTVLRASSSGGNSNPATREKRNHADDIEKMQSDQKKRRRVEKSDSRKQSRRAEDPARAQVCDNPRVHPAGGSPKDDSLLLGNEYTYIDLLHEVVQNHGRWTRDRWRQTQINKHKLKQQGQSR
ncbi:uncharacterized protein [Misgurnus anguillicaudatus]|uniref:uncharacterized protein isoform X1 n=1 Tax=Misgurnus anguillicaudatus TaxID=75329 RepID=UPI003CCF66E9